MREANEIGSGSGACARQERGVRRRSAPFRSCSSLGFGLLEENRKAVQRFARLCSLYGHNWAARWHLAQAVGKRFRGAAQSVSVLRELAGS